MKDYKILFKPIKIASMTVKNRVVMAPMATDFADGEGPVSDKIRNYYEARARGGVGLITVEVCSIDRLYPYIPRTLGLWDDSLIDGLKSLTDAAHRHGAKIIPQIAHPGPESLSPIFTGEEALGPSAGIRNGITRMKCRELSRSEIRDIIDRFGRAALRAKQAGFDGVEFHAAHGYMLAGSFLSALKNRRTDEYGGSLERRLRFTIESIESIKKYAGDDFPVVIRISADELVPGGRSIGETQYIVPILESAGVDGFHVSAGVYPSTSWRVIPPAGTPFGINAPLSKMVRDATGKPVIVVGRITSPGLAESILERGEADMVALGRALIADPEFVNKAFEGRADDIAPCIGCGLGCVTNREKGGDMTCVINPLVGHEGEPVPAPGRKKKVMVIGGGPAGLAASRAAASRGHDVILYEMQDRPGGQLNLACIAHSKREITGLIRHLTDQSIKAGVTIKTGIEATEELIAREKPDVAVIATGARTCTPLICGCGESGIICSREFLAGGADIDTGRVLIIGGGMVGCEVAEILASTGDNISEGRTSVTIVEMNDILGADMYSEARYFLMKELREKGVEMITGAVVSRIFTDGAEILLNGETREFHGYDHVINAMGAESVNGLAPFAEKYAGETYVIGDAQQPRQALQAISEGYEVGNKI
ncbi:MAG TPA: FAD-dependent oxidoreductase [Spirochaetota bacterium]|nr:FAD-dependent oxidoreductase [Spirochaetota bacterium]HRZ25560.1 FAD-dependent oxidoreductase [Spirochaetota bacterium]HSA13261.1 FAD-dependent oxidoreductase [Spirochaetota bacterium]